MKKKVIEFFLACFLLYFGFLVIMYVTQRSYIFFPDKNYPDVKQYGIEGLNEISVQTSDDLALRGAYAEPKDNKPVIVMFHGNAGHIGIRVYKAEPYIEAGYGFLLAGYRGYGGNDGKPTEQGLYKDGRAYIDWLSQEKNVKTENIILYGESLGTGVAVQLATEHPVKAVILETPFTTLPDVGQKHMFYLPVKLLAKDRFDNLTKIKNVNAPIIILHGELDMIVPFAFGKRLFEAANEPKTMEVFKAGGHNNLYMYGSAQKVMHFLAGLKQ